MKAHHTRIKFLFNLLFNDLRTIPKTKKERKERYESIKDYKNMRRRLWRKEINMLQSDRKHKQKRKQYGKIHLNSIFLNSDAHHIDKDHIINIPHSIHNGCWHSHDVPESMREINFEAFKFLMNEMMS